ncbi:hypothetical protein Tco_0591741 [Tanacetum coccineum]
MLSATRVKLSTSASGSQPSSSTKKDKIQQTPSSTQKNKVEAYPRKCNGCMLSDNHDMCVLDFINNVNARVKSKFVKKSSKRKVWKLTGKVFTNIGTSRRTYWSSKLNDHVAKILGYGDYQIENVTISRVYYVEGLGHNLFSVGQFCDSNLEVAFRQHTCFIRNLEGVDLLTGSRGNNLYTLSFGDMMASSPICLLSKASKTKRIIEIIHVDFDELTAMASEHSSSGPALHEMTPATISSGLVPNPPPSTPVDNPAPEVIAPIAEVVAPKPAESAVHLPQQTVDHDAPSPYVAHMNNDPFFGIPIPENDSKASSSSDVIPTVVHTATPNSKHVNK